MLAPKAVLWCDLPMPSKIKRIVKWDIDEADALCSSSGRDCVYWQTAKGPRGWYVTTVVDSEHFVEDFFVDDGPYASEAEAYCAGFYSAADWFEDNRIRPDAADYRDFRKRCRA